MGQSYIIEVRRYKGDAPQKNKIAAKDGSQDILGRK